MFRIIRERFSYAKIIYRTGCLQRWNVTKYIYPSAYQYFLPDVTSLYFKGKRCTFTSPYLFDNKDLFRLRFYIKNNLTKYNALIRIKVLVHDTCLQQSVSGCQFSDVCELLAVPAKIHFPSKFSNISQTRQNKKQITVTSR